MWFNDGNTELLTVKVLPRMEMSVYFELLTQLDSAHNDHDIQPEHCSSRARVVYTSPLSKIWLRLDASSPWSERMATHR